MLNKSTLTKLTLTCGLASTLCVQAQTATATSSTLIEQTNKSVKDSEYFGSVAFQSNQLMDDVGEVVGNQYFGEIDFNYESLDYDLDKKFNAALRVNDEGQLMYSLPEAYLKYKFTTTEVTLGRVILPWNKIDQIWGFGKLNNRRNFDFYEPGQEGLVGFLLEKKWNNGVKVALFASALYVPELNPGQTIDKENGKISCENPWCTPISDTAPVNDRDVPIFYNVNYPEIPGDVIFRYTTGYRIGWEDKSKAWDISHFAIRKPENQMSISAEISYEVSDDLIYADVTPQFYYHDVFGAEVRFKPYNLSSKHEGVNWMKGLTVYGSAMSIRPEKYPDGDQPYIEYTGIKPEKRKEDYVGAGVLYEYGRMAMSLNYVARISEFDIKNEILAEAPRWNQALNFSFIAHITRKLSAGFDVKTDMLTEDRVTMFRANYELSPEVITSVGVNMIGASDANSFWADFENNDQVYASLRYVF